MSWRRIVETNDLLNILFPENTQGHPLSIADINEIISAMILLLTAQPMDQGVIGKLL